MLESFKGNKLEYTRLTPEEMSQRGILGRLTGVMCDTTEGTRNNRKYSKELWEKALDDELFKEKLENHCIFAELEHPENRTAVDPREACAALAEMPKIGADGKIYGVWDILNTPNGQILKTFCDYGTNIGISSRGEGDVIESYDGDEVDPDSYALETFDMVLLPAVKAARLNYVTESIDNKKSLKQALTENLNKAKGKDKEIMKKTLKKIENKLTEGKKLEFKDDIVVVRQNGKVVAKGLWDDIKYGWEDIIDSPDTKFDGVQYVNRKEKIAIEVLDPEVDQPDIQLKESNGKEKIYKGFTIKQHEDSDKFDVFDQFGYSLEVQKLADKNGTYASINDAEQEIDDLINSKVYNDKGEYLEESKAVEDDDYDESLKQALTEKLKLSKEDKEKIYDLSAMLNDWDDDGDFLIELAESNKATYNAIMKAYKEYADKQKEFEESISENCGDKKANENVKEIVDDKSNMINELQEALKAKKDLKANTEKLQSELAVSDAKVHDLTEELNKYKELTAKLAIKAKESKKLSKEVNTLTEKINANKTKTSNLVERVEKTTTNVRSLNEELKKAKHELTKANLSVSKLTERLADEKADKLAIANDAAKVKNKALKLVEAYKIAANDTMTKYIESRATMLGITVNEIKNALPRSYTAKDVDNVCESLQRYSLNMSKLPFSLNNKVKVRFSESKNDNLRVENLADEIDDQLLELAKLKY